MTTENTTGEVLARAVTLEVEDGIAVIRIDQPGKPVNVLSEQVVTELAELIGRLESRELDVRGVVLSSGKRGVWIAGADIEQLQGVRTAADGEALSRTAHRLLARLESLPFPVVAAIEGAALGGGLEIALASTYRIAGDSPKTRLGLPEVQLGLLPGAGGTQRLPRLVGIRAALDLMLTGKQLDARRARKMGLVDEVVPSAIIVERGKQAARELAERRLEPRAGRPRGSPHWVENLPGLRAFIFRKAKQEVMKKSRGHYPAPLRILEVTERGLDRALAEGLDLEARAFGELTVTPEAHSLTHLFFASTAAKNDPMLAEGAGARPVERVAIVGAGFMGTGIGVVSAEAGLRVRLKDVDAESVAKGLSTARKSLTKRAQRRRRPDHEIVQLTDRLEGTTEYSGFRSSDLVVEAVFEAVDLKHRVLREIEAGVAPDTIIGSNTSTIPIGTLAEAAERPERVIGLHFFSPVEKMPLLEIIVTPETDPSVAATCHAYAKRIGKTPIIVNDAPGFYINRILAPYMSEAGALIGQGVRIEEIDSAMVDWGFPVGPVTLFDEVGLDVALHAGKIMAEAFSDRLQPNDALEKLVESGRLGRKNGRGFFRYEDGKKKGVDESVYGVVGAPQRRSLPAEEIQDRLALGMINEAVRCLEDGVIRSTRDGDVGAVFGIGFPPFRGGPFWYLDRVGAARVVDRLRSLEVAHGPRFSPAPLLVRKAASGEPFGEE